MKICSEYKAGQLRLLNIRINSLLLAKRASHASQHAQNTFWQILVLSFVFFDTSIFAMTAHARCHR